MTILELERELIKTREKLASEERSHDAEIRRIAAELGFPLGGVTTEQIIGRIRELQKCPRCKHKHAADGMNCGADIGIPGTVCECDL